MAGPDNAQWVLEVMTLLQSPDTELVRDLLGHLASLRTRQTAGPPSASGSPPSVLLDLPSKADNGSAREVELQIRRQALYDRLRDHWLKARQFPRCLKHAQVLRETAVLAIHAQIVCDPMADETAVPLTLEQAKCYAAQAVEIAEEIGDRVELIEAFLALGQHHKLTADYDEARRYTLKALELAGQINSLHHLSVAYRNLQELLTLTDPDPGSQISLVRHHLAVLEKQGDAFHLAIFREELARLLIFSGDLSSAAEALRQAAAAIDQIPLGENVTGYADHPRGRYHRYCALLYRAQGQLTKAVEEMQKAMVQSSQCERYRDYVLGTDLALLETLYLQLQDRAGFAAFCQRIRLDSMGPLKYWYLSPETPPRRDQDAEAVVPLALGDSHWHWTDPLQKGTHVLADGLEISPVMGTGFLSNVYAPRMMREVAGDFTFEVTLDYGSDLRRAGGILVYQDDNTLIRYGIGIHFDGEVTLTGKSSEQGFYVVGRGLLEGSRYILRLTREAGWFTAWCSDGGTWYRCGRIAVRMGRQIQVGLFAECAYRDWFSPTRCTTTPVRFAEARLSTGSRSGS